MLQAILKTEYEDHARAGSCKPAMAPSKGFSCPLCSHSVGSDKEGWKRHFVEEGCPANPRTKA